MISITRFWAQVRGVVDPPTRIRHSCIAHISPIVFARTRWRHLSDAHDAIWINVMIISWPLFLLFALISTFHYKERGMRVE